jgi:type II secretory pathway component PulF
MLGVLLESRVPLLDALGLTCETAVHPAYRALIERAKDAVTRGESVSSVLGQSDLINPAVQVALRTGEQSGRLGEPLVQMADFLDEENEVVVKALTTLLEPAILIVLGLIVGVMALSMFLPLFDLVSAASGGAK